MKRSALVAGASTVTLAALIVVKMLALDWAGKKLQNRFGRP